MTLNRSMFSALSSHALLRGRQTGHAQGRRGQHLRPATRQLLPQELRSIHPLPAPSKGTGGTGTEVAWELGAGLCVRPPRDTAARAEGLWPTALEKHCPADVLCEAGNLGYL